MPNFYKVSELIYINVEAIIRTEYRDRHYYLIGPGEVNGHQDSCKLTLEEYSKFIEIHGVPNVT